MATRPTHYATLATPGTKKISVCARRVGSRERLTVIATCSDEGTAEKIVDALNLHQGKLEQLEVPAQRVLEEVRVQLAKERQLVNDVRREKQDLQRKHDDEVRGLRQQSVINERECARLRAEFAAYRDAHPAEATEKA